MSDIKAIVDILNTVSLNAYQKALRGEKYLVTENYGEAQRLKKLIDRALIEELENCKIKATHAATGHCSLESLIDNRIKMLKESKS